MALAPRRRSHRRAREGVTRFACQRAGREPKPARHYSPSLAMLAHRSPGMTQHLEEIISLKQAVQIAAPFTVVQREQFFRPGLSALDEFVQWLQETLFAGT